ncbi:hypothetical protein ACH4GP_19090 [Streptomyces celluloflavus]|uniref:Uncharacterized protein n=1 Tax=Streptomyces celluloflavus TaxID=58344 RepID=A0ABW7RGI3_9ACTN
MTFQIDTTPGLWSKTSKQTAYAADDQKIDAKVTKLGSGLQRVELSGIGLANYLWQLDYHAHGGAGGSAPWSRYREAEAVRMYDEISHKLDSVEKRPSPDDPPLRIEVDDAFLSAKHK